MFLLSSNSRDWPNVCCVYKITNLVNHKFYIGSTFNFRLRMSEHRTVSRSKTEYETTPLYNAIRKYGEESFSCEPIYFCTRQNVRDFELHFITESLSEWGNTYNVSKQSKFVDFNDSVIRENHFKSLTTRKSIKQYSMDGSFIAEYDSLSFVETEFGFNHSKISNCIHHNRRSAYGYQWRLSDDPTPVESYERNNHSQRVLQIDKQTGQTINSFDSYYSAAKSVTGKTDEKDIGKAGNKISQCARGLRKTAYKFKWEIGED